MSGGFDPISTGAGQGKKSIDSNCDTLTMTVTLHSPVEAVISKLKINDILEIVYSNNSVLALDANGETAGSIIGADMARLATCIEKGHTYKGTVFQLNGGNCKLKITHR